MHHIAQLVEIKKGNDERCLFCQYTLKINDHQAFVELV